MIKSSVLLAALLLAGLSSGVDAAPVLPDYVNSEARSALTSWLSAHPKYRVLTDRDCECDDDLRQIRTHTTGVWKADPDYHPFYVIGDFRHDKHRDVAVFVEEIPSHTRRVLVIDDIARPGAGRGAFVSSDIGRYETLFYGPPRPKPYDLVVGRYESEGRLLKPRGRGGYRLD